MRMEVSRISATKVDALSGSEQRSPALPQMQLRTNSGEIDRKPSKILSLTKISDARSGGSALWGLLFASA